MVFSSKKFALLAVVLLASCLGCTPRENHKQAENIVADNASASSAASKLPEDIDGVWVSKKYLLSLKANKTPFAANPESFEINREEERFTWTNFHESYWREIYSSGVENDHYFMVVSQPEDPDTSAGYVAFAIEEGELNFIEGEIAEQIDEPFIKIPSSLPQYANTLLLAGKYKDAKGNHYEFSEEGTATWPNLRFSYELVLDSSEAGCPYVSTDLKDADGNPKRFGYTWQADSLLIYEIVEGGDFPISCASKPYLQLTKE
ncbi:MAG TPA: hypothetical protein VN030_06475 [Cellvibrio sp.]|nr:hypothetical protein [Cellvibrio sp.]